MNKLYSIAQIRELEQIAIKKFNIDENILMEHAGTAALNFLQKIWPHVRYFVIFCGKGNNGGDGYVLAKEAKKRGFHVDIYQLGSTDDLKGAAKEAALACQSLDIQIRPVSSASIKAMKAYELAIDALLGIGLQGDVKQEYLDCIAFINKLTCPILSIDVPSGLNADTGQVLGKAAVIADATLTYIGLKRGLFTGQAAEYVGYTELATLDVPEEAYEQVPPEGKILISKLIRKALPERLRASHKGDFGHVLIVGGNKGMAGAARLAGEAAARSGAGLVSVATKPAHIDIISVSRPELMAHGIEKASDLDKLLSKATVVAIGPGLGQDEWSRDLFYHILKAKVFKIIDADALNLLIKSDVKLPRDDWILTPHPGEASRLLETDLPSIQKDRFEAIRKLQQKFGGIIVLKGAGTLIADESSYRICTLGNPGMASGGMGDVLTGVIAGLLAQRLTLYESATAGVFAHAKAGDMAAAEKGERGLLALDLMPHLRQIVNARFE